MDRSGAVDKDFVNQCYCLLGSDLSFARIPRVNICWDSAAVCPVSIARTWINNPSELKMSLAPKWAGSRPVELLNMSRVAWEGLEFRLAMPRDVRTGDGDLLPAEAQPLGR